MTISEVEPIRVLFNVSLDSSVTAEALEKALYDESNPLHVYIASHLSDDKKSVTFLSNLFSGKSVSEGVTVGDTTATFTPSTGNMFYRFTEDTPIYKDESLETRVNSVDDLDTTGTTSYYYPYTYHETSGDGTVESVTEAVEFPGSNIVKEGEGKNVAEGNNGAYIMEGSDRVTRIDNINEAKAENATGTASTVLSPIWQDISQRSGNGGLSAIMARLGNNGKVFFKLPGTLEVTKTVDYGNGDKEKLEEKDFSFTFTLELTGSPADKTYTGVITNENDVKTSEVTFSATGGSFTLKDGETLTVKGLVDGMDYTVKETDVPTGFTSSATGEKGTIVSNDTVTASFTNTYNAQPAKVSFPVSKELSGRDWRDSDAFTFTLSAEGDVPMPAEGGDTVTITKDTANHAATFGEISFDEIGTYVYHIKENTTGSTIPGLSYSGATYKVTVEVTDDLAGHLQSEVTITQVQDESALTVLEGESSASEAAEFKNTYNYKKGTAVISGTKSYTDHTDGNKIEDGKFTFKLAPVDGAPMPQDKDGNIIDVVSNVGTGFSFPEITFDGNDVGKTYVYTITEQSGTETGMTYDGMTFKAYISVTEANDEDGKAVISAAVTYKMVGENDVETDVEQPKFENEYNADPAKLALGGTKELAGRDMKETDAFTFCLVPSKETFDSGSVMVGESLITEGGLKQTVSGPAEKGQGVPFSFDELTFTQAGKYTFDLYEEQGNAGGVTYDTEHRTVKVTVTLDKDNKLVASADYGTIGNGEDARPGNEFVNTYEATGTYQGVNVAVKLVGKPMSTGDFGFTITSDDSDALAKLAESDKSFENVTEQDSDVFETMAKLPNMTFDQDDAGETFVYTVDEIMPVSGDAMPGVDYDESEYILEITAIDNGDGTMSTSTKITQVKDSEGETVSNVIYETTPDGGVENPTIPFINIYTPKPATATLNVTKAVYGKDAIESFSFDLTLSSGDKSSVKVAQDDGSLADFTGAKLATSAGIKAGTTEELTFETLTFTKVGTYVFNVDETTTTDEHGWHYDEATHTITVEVTDENYDGQLDAAVKDDNPTFTNYYADATIGGNTKQPLPVNKIVKAQNVGSDWSTDNDFNFTLTPVTGEGDNETDWSSTSCGTTALRTGITDPIKSGDKKTAHFDEITFYEVGEYHFVVTEDEAQRQEPAGWTYDKSKKEIIVTVTDKDTTDGKLDVTVEGEATFTNTFDPSAVEFTPLPVTKVVKPNDAGLTPAGYQFELSVSNTLEGHEGEGFKLPGSVTSESDDTGKVTFDNITFTQVGTYEVTVKEVVPEDANQEQPGVQDENHITYDQHVFTYTVDVTVGEGTLVASVVESTVTSGADTFTNVYFDPVKEVSGSADDGTLTDGSVAAVGDVLTYTIHWSNNAVDKDGVPTNATVTVTDKVPEHTTYVADSASEGGVEKDGTITWTFENQEPGASGTVTYEVTVDESAAQVGVVDNTATVQIGENGPDIDTNTVTTVIPSKDVVAPSDPDTSIDGQLVGVGDKLTYVISYTNPYEEPSTVIITDAVPAGTEFVSADNGGTQSDGTVTWTIEEVPAGESGTVSFTVRVTEEALEKDAVTNTASVKIGENGPEVKTNTTENPVQTGSLTISKTIELTPDQGTVIDKDQEFQFTVKVLDTAGKPITGTYSGLDFSDEGTASFSLKHGESMTIEGLPAGATYTVTETPVDHYTQTTPADGAPATGTIPADGAAEAAFVNTYKADDSDPTTLELTKVFEGHEWTEGYSFTFVLAGENGAPMPENNTVTVSGPQPTGEAPIAFGPITYKGVGTYTYTVTETAGENPGIGYDAHTAKVTVEVSDVDGKLTPSVTYEKDVFTNTYDTGTVTVDTSVGLQVVKNMTGRDIKPGDFTFTMTGADDASVARLNDGQPLSFSTSGAALDSASNVASETINVPTGLTFTNEDAGNTYTYTVSENVPEGAVDNELDGVTYDDTVYTVAFAITENGKGTLSVETFVDGESQGVVSAAVATNALPAQLVFDNSYDAGEASVDVSATKVLKNHELTDGMFTFDVYNDSVAEGGEARHVLTASNAADGSVSLGTLSYTTAGINADVAAGYATRTAGEGRSATYVYGYTVHEAAVEGVTNNTGDLHFTVTVTDDGAGHLHLYHHGVR